MSDVAKATALVEFAAQLRAWRKRFRWTQVELATKLVCSSSLVSGVETMDKSPTADFACRCDTVFGLPGTFEAFHKLVAREAYPAFFAPAVEFEQKAARIHGWEIGAVPGLLQTEDYARALITDTQATDTASNIDRLVSGRIGRQAVLDGERPPMLWHVLDESVLRRVIGSPATMRTQLDRLIEVAERPTIVLQVLPFGADNHAGSDGPITVYEFAKAPAVGYAECFAGGRLVEEHDEVAGLIMTVSLIRAAALSPRRSVEVIQQIRSDLR